MTMQSLIMEQTYIDQDMISGSFSHAAGSQSLFSSANPFVAYPTQAMKKDLPEQFEEECLSSHTSEESNSDRSGPCQDTIWLSDDESLDVETVGSSDSDPSSPRAIAKEEPFKCPYEIIPKFFHEGKRNCSFNQPVNPAACDRHSQEFKEICAVFRVYPNRSMPLADFANKVIRRFCQIPFYFDKLLVQRLFTLYPETFESSHLISSIPFKAFSRFWLQEFAPFDAIERIFRLLKRPDQEVVFADDLIPLMQEIIDLHPALGVLREHAAFREKYILTVIVRMFYKVNVSRSGKLSLREFRQSNIVSTLSYLEMDSNINNELDYFNYQHFYVLYVTFLELDDDSDGLLWPQNLLQYGNFALTPAIVHRIFQVGERVFTDGGHGFPDGMTYADFIYFFLSDINKTSMCSLRYWFRCCDWDDDGHIALRDLEELFRSQQARLSMLSAPSEESSSAVSTLSWRDVSAQILDLIAPENRESITLQDLTVNRMAMLDTGILFDQCFHTKRCVQWESRSPAQLSMRRNDYIRNDWDRFAASEYIRLVREDAAKAQSTQMEDNICCNSNPYNSYV